MSPGSRSVGMGVETREKRKHDCESYCCGQLKHRPVVYHLWKCIKHISEVAHQTKGKETVLVTNFISIWLRVALRGLTSLHVQAKWFPTVLRKPKAENTGPSLWPWVGTLVTASVHHSYLKSGELMRWSEGHHKCRLRSIYSFMTLLDLQSTFLRYSGSFSSFS